MATETKDFETLIAEARALPIAERSTIAYLRRKYESETVFVTASKLEVILRSIIGYDAKEDFGRLEMDEPSTYGLEFRTLEPEPPWPIIDIAGPIALSVFGPPPPKPVYVYPEMGVGYAPDPPKRRDYRLVRYKDGLFALIGHVEHMRDKAVDEALKTMEGLKPTIDDIVVYVERKHSFRVPRKAVQKEILLTRTPLLLAYLSLRLQLILKDFDIIGPPRLLNFVEDEPTPAGKALLWMVDNSPTIGTIGALVILALPAIGLMWGLDFVWPMIQTWIQHYGWFAELPALGTLLLLAGALYQTKRRLPRLYGLSGIEGGLIACWVGLQNIGAQGWAAAAALAGGVYAMVGGLENYWKSLEEKRENRAKIEQIKMAA